MQSRVTFTCCLLALAVLLASAPTQGASIQKRRAVSESPDQEIVKICHDSTPCEWAVYIPFTRRIDYIMKNTCECSKDMVCTRAYDDLSVSAYVHRCRSPPSPPASGT